MATFDQLSAEQRAIVELVLKQGQSYDQLSDMLGLPSPRVRDLARKALVRLSPVSAAAVEDDWQAQLTDYLLNQQSGPEATATRGHLRRSEASRGWARSVLDSLEQFYDEKSIPSIPDGDARAEREPREKRERRPARPRGELSSGAQAAIKRRRLLGAGALAALVLALVVLVWPVGLLTGDDDSSKASSSGGGAGTQGTGDGEQPQVVGQLPLAPVEDLEGDKDAAGQAGIVSNGEALQLVVQARLPQNARNEAYEVWLYNSDEDAQSVGAQVANAQGVFQGAKELPEGYEKYKFIDVSREPVTGPKAHSGTSVLRGSFEDFVAAETEGGATPEQGQQPAPQTPAPPAPEQP